MRKDFNIMRINVSRIGLGALGLLILAATGCLWDLVSWSPDGRFIAFVDKGSGELWRWDTQTESVQRLTMEIDDKTSRTTIATKAAGCRYLPGGDKLTVLNERGDNDG
jgi:hypothetical protein